MKLTRWLILTIAVLALIAPALAVTQYNYTINGDTIIVFNGTAGSTTWTPPAGVTNISYLVVAGGGGGAGDVLTGIGGGGGGAGGMLQRDDIPVANLGTAPLTVIIGAGGTGGVGRPSVGQTAGGFSLLGNVNATGGGPGAGYGLTISLSNGGSGGGGAGLQAGSGTGVAGTYGQGFNGNSSVAQDGGCGGGGSATVGYLSAAGHHGGDGGRGNVSMITRVATYYAGGGAGAAPQGTGTGGGIGGIGGGGNGGDGTSVGPTSGAANTGGGGGGGTTVAAGGGGASGGSGIIIIRYPTPVTTGLTWTAEGTHYKSSDNGVNYVMFNQTGSESYTIPSGAYTMNYVVVAGGGSGGAAPGTAGSGGGAGGVVAGALAVTPGTSVTVTVGAGGNAVFSSGAHIAGYAGSNSVFSTITAIGGGRGGGWNNATATPGSGGSGGGGSYTSAQGTGTAGQGKDGGAGYTNVPAYGTGGGGGNTTAGADGTAYTAGNGGLGGVFNILGGSRSLYLAGGGGGALYPDTGSNISSYFLGMGKYGGGDGGANAIRVATNGTPNTGGGGGGYGGTAGTGKSGAGGSGVVYLNYTPVIPIAQFSANITNGTVRLPVQFTDGSVLNPTAWNWSFTPVQGGNYSTSQNPTYTFLNAGTFNVLLNVTNASGYNTTTNQIVVMPPASAPSAKFTVNRTIAYLPNGAVNFTDASTPNIYGWTWNYTKSGVPTTFSTSQNPEYAFTSVGTYYVTVNATNYLGSTTSAATAITVNGFDAPIANFTANPSTGSPGVLVQFNDTSTIPNTNGLVYNWSFGDPGISLTPFSDQIGSVSHVYNYGGVYNVNLTVTNYNGTSYSYQIAAVTVSTSQSTSNWYSPHQVKLRVMDQNDNIQTNLNVTAIAYESSLPGGFAGSAAVLEQMYGINNIQAMQMVNGATQMAGYTGGDGSITFTMHGSLKYLITITTSTGQVFTKTLYPIESEYIIRTTNGGYTAPQDVTNRYASIGNASLTFSEPNTSYITMGVDYLDISGDTTNLVFNVILTNNGTTMYSASQAVTGQQHILMNYTAPNRRGQSWQWNYNATVVT